MATFKTSNENEANALVTYFTDCGFTASRKGNVVKASGDDKLLKYFYSKFLTLVLL